MLYNRDVAGYILFYALHSYIHMIYIYIYICIDIRCGVSCLSQRAQALKAIGQILEGYHTFGHAAAGTSLTYDRVVTDLKTAQDTVQAAVYTDNESIMDIWFAPPIHRGTPIIDPLRYRCCTTVGRQIGAICIGVPCTDCSGSDSYREVVHENERQQRQLR